MTKQQIIEQFSKIKGLGKAKAELLYNNGFNSLEKIQKSSIEKLIEIKGINEKIANDIKAQVDELLKHNNSKTNDEKNIQKESKEEKQKATDRKYIVKKKPKLSGNQIKNFKIRKQIKKRTPNFLREEWFRYKRLSKNWRRPDGITSKMRINLKYRPNKVRVGYRGPKDMRGFHSSGFEEVLVHNIKELQNIDNTIQAVRIGSTVGIKKRLEIQKEAEKLDIRILNIGEI